MFNVFSNVVEQDHLKLCMMITSIMLYMFIQVLLFLIQFQCHWRIWKNMKFVFSIVNVSQLGVCCSYFYFIFYILYTLLSLLGNLVRLTCKSNPIQVLQVSVGSFHVSIIHNHPDIIFAVDWVLRTNYLSIRNPPNSDMDYKMFIMRTWSFLYMNIYTWGLGTQTMSQHNIFDWKISQIFLVLLMGFKSRVFGSRVRSSTNWATPSPRCFFLFMHFDFIIPPVTTLVFLFWGFIESELHSVWLWCYIHAFFFFHSLGI